MYKCFKRTWWVENPTWPNGLEPEAGIKRWFKDAEFENESDAVDFCKKWNATHPKGRYGLKAEYTEV